jgi:predicted TIM-barrel fold metal-dependent hydrolase
MSGSLDLVEDLLAGELFAELEQIGTVDAHEHLPPETSRLGEPRDFYSLFQHYCAADLISAGASEEDLKCFGDRDRPLEERWTRFRPFLQAIRTGGYARSALIVIRDLLGIPDLDDGTYETVGEELSNLNKPGVYDYVLREKCNLAACIQCWQLGSGPFPEYFRHLAPGPEVVDLASRAATDALGDRCNLAIHRLDDVLECMTVTVDRWRSDPKVVGIKSAHAYSRGIGFRKVARAEAETVFNKILTHEGHAVDAYTVLPLQDYLMFELAARAEAAGLPMVFHTGLQAGNFNRIRNADPLLLQDLLEEFPRLKVDLFHGGMPWVREIAVLAKYFPNVHLNMAWMHVINPAQARSALCEWLDMVPNTKIFGFGGDYSIVEKVYGHLKLARWNVAAVLAEKVREGAYSRQEAGMVAHRLMRENADRFYNLGLDATG